MRLQHCATQAVTGRVRETSATEAVAVIKVCFWSPQKLRGVAVHCCCSAELVLKYNTASAAAHEIAKSESMEQHGFSVYTSSLQLLFSRWILGLTFARERSLFRTPLRCIRLVQIDVIHHGCKQSMQFSHLRRHPGSRRVVNRYLLPKNTLPSLPCKHLNSAPACGRRRFGGVFRLSAFCEISSTKQAAGRRRGEYTRVHINTNTRSCPEPLKK